VGVLQRFERRLGGLVEGAFAKVFKGGVEPVELAGALARECDDRKAISATRSLVPNEFTIHLSDQDYERLSPYSQALGEELATLVREHAAEQRYTFVGPVLVRLEHDSELQLGIYRVDSAVGSAPGLAGPGAGRHQASDRSQESNGRPRLVLTTGGSVRAGTAHAAGAENEYSLDKELVVIGRGSEADLRLADTGVSRRHGEIREIGESRHAYRDLGSTNGSKVNGKASTPANPIQLRDGDRIEVGKSALVYRKDETPRSDGGRQGGEGSGASNEA
jgi:FHA domain-containing protein